MQCIIALHAAFTGHIINTFGLLLLNSIALLITPTSHQGTIPSVLVCCSLAVWCRAKSIPTLASNIVPSYCTLNAHNYSPCRATPTKPAPRGLGKGKRGERRRKKHLKPILHTLPILILHCFPDNGPAKSSVRIRPNCHFPSNGIPVTTTFEEITRSRCLHVLVSTLLKHRVMYRGPLCVGLTQYLRLQGGEWRCQC